MGLDLIVSVMIIAMAIASLRAEALRASIIFFGIMSLVASFLFLIYQSPDVALAEAVVGSGLVTLLFLVALRQYRVYRVCFVHETESIDADRSVRQAERDNITGSIEQFCHGRELELQLVVSHRSLAFESENPNYDIILSRTKEGLLEIHGNEENVLLVEMMFFLQWNHTELEMHLHGTREEP